MEKICGYKASDGCIYSTPEEVEYVEYEKKLYPALEKVTKFMRPIHNSRLSVYDSRETYAQHEVWERLHRRFSKEFEIRALKVAIDEYVELLDKKPKLPEQTKVFSKTNKPQHKGFWKSLFE